MRSSKQRSRAKPNRPRTMGNIVNRVFDSSGPESKVRGTPQQIIEKYQVLARDAQLSNDRVAYENFLQHSEHYTRMLGEATRELQREADERRDQPGQPRGGDPSDMRYDGQPRDAQVRDAQFRDAQFRDERDDDGGDAEPYVDPPRSQQPQNQQHSQPRPQHQPRPQQQRNDQERFQNDRPADRPADRQGDRQNDRQGDRQNDRNGDRHPDRNGDRQPQERQAQDRQPQDRQPQDRQPQDRQPQERQADRQPQERQPRERPSQPRPVVDGTAELPAFISAPVPKTERPAPDRSPLTDVIELDDDRDTDSGLVDTPEMPADEKQTAKAPRRRTPRKAKVEAEGVPQAPQPTAGSTDEAAE